MPAKAFNYKSLVRGALRRIWMWSPARREAIRNARVAPGILECRGCGLRMKENPKKPIKKDYQVDHLVPASEPAALIHNWDDFIIRLFECPVSELRVLCKGCHDVKTKTENQTRRARPSVKRKRRRASRNAR